MKASVGCARPARLNHGHFTTCSAGLVGAVSFAPITAIFPIELWIHSKRPSHRVCLGLRTLSGLAVLVTLATTAGSLQRLITSWGSFNLFGAD